MWSRFASHFVDREIGKDEAERINVPATAWSPPWWDRYLGTKTDEAGLGGLSEEEIQGNRPGVKFRRQGRQKPWGSKEASPGWAVLSSPSSPKLLLSVTALLPVDSGMSLSPFSLFHYPCFIFPGVVIRHKWRTDVTRTPLNNSIY
jgi:hypothetical protein